MRQRLTILLAVIVAILLAVPLEPALSYAPESWHVDTDQSPAESHSAGSNARVVLAQSNSQWYLQQQRQQQILRQQQDQMRRQQEMQRRQQEMVRRQHQQREAMKQQQMQRQQQEIAKRQAQSQNNIKTDRSHTPKNYNSSYKYSNLALNSKYKMNQKISRRFSLPVTQLSRPLRFQFHREWTSKLAKLNQIPIKNIGFREIHGALNQYNNNFFGKRFNANAVESRNTGKTVSSGGPRKPLSLKTVFSQVAWQKGGLTAKPVGSGTSLFLQRISQRTLWSSTKKLSSLQNAYAHWKSHRHEFPEIQNAKRYVETVNKFLRHPPVGTLTRIRNNGEIVRYDAMTNTFAVADKFGSPKTMFRPDPAKHGFKTNMEYFYAQ